MSGRLTRRFETWIDEAIEKYGMGETIVYEIQFNPQPPTMAVILFMPGIILNSWVQNIMIVQDVLAVDKEGCHEIMRQAFEVLRNTRTQQGVEEMASANGGKSHSIEHP